MKYLMMIAILLAGVVSAEAMCLEPDYSFVKGYVRQDGTAVGPYIRHK